MAKKKLKKPSAEAVARSFLWLDYAKHELGNNEYYEVKKLCGQVIRALKRKNNEKTKT